MKEPIAISVTEAARLLGLSRPTVYALMRREDFPAFQVGTRRLISREGLERWVEAQIGGK
jgi:excisionase family DNA binding protein